MIQHLSSIGADRSLPPGAIRETEELEALPETAAAVQDYTYYLLYTSARFAFFHHW